jgi:hypothetical protein
VSFETGKPKVNSTNAAGRKSRPGGSLIVRSLVWVVISSAFLVWNLRRMMQMHALGLNLGWWAYLQVVLWLIALGFWLQMGWREFRRRDSNVG